MCTSQPDRHPGTYLPTKRYGVLPLKNRRTPVRRESKNRKPRSQLGTMSGSHSERRRARSATLVQLTSGQKRCIQYRKSSSLAVHLATSLGGMRNLCIRTGCRRCRKFAGRWGTRIDRNFQRLTLRRKRGLGYLDWLRRSLR